MVEMQLLEELPFSSSELAAATKISFKSLVEALETGKQISPAERYNVNMEEFALQNGCLFRGHRVVIPEKFQKMVLKELHTAHFGISKMKALARSVVWWPGISSAIEEMVKSCAECLQTAKEPKKAPIHHWEMPSRPFERVHVDFAGPFLEVRFFILVDALSKWPEITVVKHEDSQTAIRCCEEIFSRFGLPLILVSDNGSAFTSGEFQEFLAHNKIRHRRTAPHHPATNGQAERHNQNFKDALKALKATSRDIHEKLRTFLTQYRRTPHSITGVSPSWVLFGHDLRTRLDAVVRPEFAETPEEGEKPLEGTREITVGDKVIARNYSSKEKKWKAGVVKRKLGKLHFEIEMENGTTWKRHLDQIKRCGEKKEETTEGGTRLKERPKRVIKKPARYR